MLITIYIPFDIPSHSANVFYIAERTLSARDGNKFETKRVKNMVNQEESVHPCFGD
jgi:hypothetical protein